MPRLIDWTPEMDARIAHPDTRLKVMAHEMGVAETSLHYRRRQLCNKGVAVNLRRRWTPQEEALLLSAPGERAATLAAALDRSTIAVCIRRKRLRKRTSS
jgi:hypothetical protein